jgi:PAS domain S-box-containing protein
MREPEFGPGEMFFSRTDSAGRILSGNGVFRRVSGYSLQEMTGRPHNLVRHPDMPRAVFELFWQVLRAGRPVAAYVLNRAKDGAPYWVIATAFPLTDGYLSIRIKPCGPLLDEVAALYAGMRDVERRLEIGQDDGGKRAAMAASRAVLATWLIRNGHDDYERFMHAALAAEVASRRGAVGPFAPGEITQHTADVTLAQVVTSAQNTYRGLRQLIGDLTQYAEISARLAEQSAFLHSLAEDIRVFSFNTLFAAGRLGADGVAIAATAAMMRDHAHSAGRHVDDLGQGIAHVLKLVDDLRFRIANAQLRTEATALFAAEMAAAADSGAEPGGSSGALDPRKRADLIGLTESLDRGVDGLLSTVHELDQNIARVSHTQALAEDLRALEALQMNGRVEAARVSAEESVIALFTSIGAQVDAAASRLAGFDAVKTFAHRDPAAEAGAREQLHHLDVLIANV